MRGVAYTVFEGVRPEPMEVEILGRLKNALGPGRDMILARLHGSRPEYTGVVAGMSGSPVYVEGKLLGALSYRIGQFSKEPIAGITPIAQMLETGGTPELIMQKALAGANTSPAIERMEAPLVFSGFGEESVTRFGDAFRTLGLLPVRGLGSMDSGQHQPEPLQPGSAVSAVLVDGDLSITGTCTVSYLVAGRLMACGHPITQSGHVSLPMAKAEVLATLSSPLNSFKIVNATEIVGSFDEDRASAISGRVGGEARMIPVALHLVPEGHETDRRDMRLRVASHRDLTPQLMMVSVYQSLQQTSSGSSEASYRVSGTIEVRRSHEAGSPGAQLPPVRFTGWQARDGFNPGAVTAALALGERFTRLYANPDEQPEITGIDLEITSSGRQRTATLDTARLSTTEAHAGDTLEVQAVLQPYQREQRVLRTTVTLPSTLEPGPLRVLISDAATLDRLLETGTGRASSLSDTVTRLNAQHANDRVYVTLLDHAAQAVLDSVALSGVPLSMANVLEPLKGSQRLRLTGESVVEAGSMPADEAVSGSQVVTLTIR